MIEKKGMSMVYEVIDTWVMFLEELLCDIVDGLSSEYDSTSHSDCYRCIEKEGSNFAPN